MKTLKKFIPLLAISALLMLHPVRTSNACGPFTYGDQRMWLFSPPINDASLAPFYFSIRFLNIDDDNDSLLNSTDVRNIDEWETYCHHEVDEAAISAVLYATEPIDFLNHIQHKKISAALSQNKFLAYLHRHRDKEAIDYLVYAKKFEHLNFTPDPWDDYAWDTKDRYAMQQLRCEGQAAYHTLTSDFIKLRYAYQFVRAARYCEDYQEAITAYDQFIAPTHTASVVGAMALSHKATALHFTGHTAHADYIFSRLFANGFNMPRSYMGFSGDSLQATLALAHNKKEVADILTLLEIGNRGKSLNALKKIYALGGPSEKFKLLVTREINKLEDWLLTKPYTNLQPATRDDWYVPDSVATANRKADLNYLIKIQAFVSAVEASTDDDFWKLCAAHLYLLNNDVDKAGTSLSAINETHLKTSPMKFQFAATSLFHSILSATVIDDNTDRKFYNGLMRLQQFQHSIKNFERLYSNMLLALLTTYHRLGKISTAAMLHSKVTTEIRQRDYDYPRNYFNYLDESASPKDLEELVRVLEKKNPTPFEKYLRENVVGNKNKLMDLWGTLYLREDSLSRALKIFKRLPDSYWHDVPYDQYLDANPFYTNQQTAPQHVHSVGDTIRYTKKDFITKLIALKTQADRTNAKEKAYLNYLIGNAYYNMTFYGNSWIMTKFYWSSTDIDSYDGIKQNEVNDFYLGCTRARKYYEKGMNTRNRALAALNCAMASICQRNEILYRKGKYIEENRFTRKLEKNYAEFYDELITECSTSADFMAKYAIR